MSPWGKNVRDVKPYTPGEQPQAANVIKLNTNENPYPPAPSVRKAMLDFEYDRLRLYPATSAEPLVSALADYHQLNEDQIFVGVGSDDVLAMSFLTFFNSDKPVLFPDITYSFYEVWAGLFRIPFECPPVDAQLHIHWEDYEKENGGVVIANPNAPTSVCENLDFICDILETNRNVVVIVDEAYIDFGGRSALELLPRYENLLVVRTFSKSRSMAGARIGFAAGSPALIRALNAVKNSFNSYTMNTPSVVMGIASIQGDVYFRQTVDRIKATRLMTEQALRDMNFEMPESKANFLFVTHPVIDAKALFMALRNENIYVRYFERPRIDNYLRITIGTDGEMDILLSFLRSYISKNDGRFH